MKLAGRKAHLYFKQGLSAKDFDRWLRAYMEASELFRQVLQFYKQIRLLIETPPPPPPWHTGKIFSPEELN